MYERYNYKKDETLPEHPVKTRNFTQDLIYFNTYLKPYFDFKQEIDLHFSLRADVSLFYTYNT